jgi:hypothetical protein
MYSFIENVNIIADDLKLGNNSKIVEASTSSQTATTKAGEASTSAQTAKSYSDVLSAYGNVDWASFIYNDGELIVSYFSTSSFTPSIVDGEFILTY